MPTTFKKFLTEQSPFLINHDEIKAWLDSMSVKNYFIGPTGIVDVQGNVFLQGKKITELPVQFGRIKETFVIGENLISSFRGCPTSVGGTFQAQRNPFLKAYDFGTLRAQSIYIGRDFVTSMATTDWSKIAAQGIVIDSHSIKEGGIGLLNIDGLEWINELRNETGKILSKPFEIIKKYIGRPDDMFDCQAELIEAGYEEYAKL